MLHKTTATAWALMFSLLVLGGTAGHAAETIATTQPAPKTPASPTNPANAPARPLEEYKLGAGDSVHIVVYNNPDMTADAQIAEDGSIPFPLVGKVVIGGLSRNAAATLIAERLVKGGFLREAQVNLTVSEYRSQQVSVLGAVSRPGKYPVGPTNTVTDLIAQAGGITEKGSQLVTVIRRGADGGQTRNQVDLRQLFGAADPSGNVRVQDQDIVFVPELPVFYIYGEVQKPGAYPLEPGMTVRQAISVGGGLTLRGTERGLRVSRKDGDGKTRTEKIKLNDTLREGDVVNVKESLF
ncbi:MAG TPA: polysaccharide export protein EpsE [Steroidobacteraceae bacterium]